MKNKTGIYFPVGNGDLILLFKAIMVSVLLLFCISRETAFAQYIILLKSGKELKANIIDESTDIIKYREYENPTGPLYSITKDKVASIKYKNGAKDAQVKQPEKKTDVKPIDATVSVQSDGLHQLTTKKRYVLLDGKVQSARSVKTLMEDHPDALHLYESGSSLCKASTACAIAVIITSFATSQIVNKKPDTEKFKTGMTGLAIDGAFIIAAIAMSSTGKHNIRRSVQIYNSEIGKPVTYRLDLGIQENGIGLALKF